MGSPRVLLLDEMMTGLAPLIVAELARTVRALARDGVVVLLAEPAIGALRGIIDRGYVLMRGAVVATGEQGGSALDDAYRTALGIERQEIAAETGEEKLGQTL
jgi:branched-chain amino acid transport system ATP-binding protein